MPAKIIRPDFDTYHMTYAVLASTRSEDPRTQVGAVIINERNRAIGTGYNAWADDTNINEFSQEREGKNILETKYSSIIHAEKNAVINAAKRLDEAKKIYVTHFPCHDCAQLVIQSGIKEVTYLLDDEHFTSDTGVAAMRLFAHSGIKVRKYSGKLEIILKKDSEQFFPRI